MGFLRLTLGLLLVLICAPLVATFFSVPPAAVASAFAAPDTRYALATSLVASLASVAVATLLGVPAGYVLARASAPWRGTGLAILAIPLALPPVAAGVTLLGLFGNRQPAGALLASVHVSAVDTLLGVTVAEFFVSGTVVAIAAAAAFAAVDPLLEDAARTLGAGPLRVFARVALPLAAPGIGAGIGFAWLRAFGEYGATSILAYHPTSLPIALVTSLSADGIPQALALAEAFALIATIVIAAGAFVRRPVR